MTTDKSHLASFPKREYGPADFQPIYEAKPYSFELNEDWLSIMANEFDMGKAATDFAKAVTGKNKDEVEAIGKDFFKKYGANLMRRSLQLGEEYMDRTYEVLKTTCDKTGGYLTWPLVPQRFIEAAVLSTQDILVIPVMQNHHDCLQFRVEDCKMYAALKQKCGHEVADLLPCRHGCLAMIETAFSDLSLGASTSMTGSTPQDKYCEFTTVRV
ncbi:hypothetical protein ACFLVW_05160 [Chloroflexota bacterium]